MSSQHVETWRIEAGVRLFQVTDPQGWEKVAREMAIVSGIGQALEAYQSLTVRDRVRIGGDRAVQ